MEKTPGSSHLNKTAGSLLVLGGLTGFAWKKSLGSAIAGLGFGGIYLASSYMIANGYPDYGHDVATVDSIAMSVVMMPRQYGKATCTVAWPLVALGGITGLYNLKKSLEWRGVIE